MGGLGGLGVQALSDSLTALQQMGHKPDTAVLKPFQHVVVNLLPRQQPQQWPLLLSVELWSGNTEAAAGAAKKGGSSSRSRGMEPEYQQHLHVLSGMVAVAENARSVRATPFEQDGEGIYAVSEALLQCAPLAAKCLKEASSCSSSSSSDSVHHAEEGAVMKLRQLAVRAVAVVDAWAVAGST